MKLTVLKRTEIEAAAIEIDAPVRYGDEDIPYDAPGRVGDRWRATVDLDTGRIRNWPGVPLDLYMKVCDEGVYRLLDSEGRELARVACYVPACIPEGGDYLSLNIDEDGTVKHWLGYCTPCVIAEGFFPKDG